MESFIWYSVSLGLALLFVGIGLYAYRCKQPMWFWAGSTVEEKTITDLPAYNRANGRMWLGYSVWYWLSALFWDIHRLTSILLLTLGGTVGTVLLIVIFNRIQRKYKQ